MSGKQTYWITDPDGTYAVVEGVEERDRWTRVHGWTVADAEPTGDAFVWLRNEDPEIGPARLNAQAAQDPAWAGRGWTPGAPPEPVNAAIAHWPRAEKATEETTAEPKSSPKSSTSKPATSGEKKE